MWYLYDYTSRSTHADYSEGVDMRYCTKCFMPETRPRIQFNSKGVCNACEWAEEKKKVDWGARLDYLKKEVIPNRKVFVPWSGGKDSIYIAHKMREIGTNPTLLCVVPHLETDIGKWNRLNTCSTFEKVFINLNPIKYRELSRHYFIKDGRPKHPWETAISAQVMKYVVQNKYLPALLVYGEDGEAEYGGTTTQLDKWMQPVDKVYLTKFYYSDNPVWDLPNDNQFAQIYMTHWSKYENWSVTTHGNYAISQGMRTEPIRNLGTLDNYSQLSDKLQDLHMYMAFIKFGFGRATADMSIAVREGWRTREDGLEIINHYDGEFPYKYLDEYLEYFDMTKERFFGIIDKHANKEILRKVGSEWVLKESVQING